MFYAVKLVIVIAATVVLSLLMILGGAFDATANESIASVSCGLG
jgi:hypothetical protein